MGLRHADRRAVTLMPPLERRGYQGSEAVAFDRERAATIPASLQPLASRREAALYGERAERMLLLLTERDAPLAEGMGVCVYITPGEGCDYRVAAPPEVWRTHCRAVLERTRGG